MARSHYRCSGEPRAVLPWPWPAFGKWEMRDSHVIEMSRLPAYASGCCYSRRVVYVDKETLLPSRIAQ